VFSQTPVEATLIEASTLVVVGTGIGGTMESWACRTDLWAIQWLGTNRCLWFMHRLAAVGLTLRSLAPISAFTWAIRDSTANNSTTTVYSTNDTATMTSTTMNSTMDSATIKTVAEETASVDASEASRKESVGSLSTSPSVYTGGDGHQEATHNHGFDALQEEIRELSIMMYIGLSSLK